jgi:hypothetical protein
MTTIRKTLALAVAAALTLLTGTAASAATVTFRDVHGRSAHFDITRVTMKNDHPYVSSKVHVRGLVSPDHDGVGDLRAEVFGINFSPIAHYDVVHYQAMTVFRANGNITASLRRYDGPSDATGTKVHCSVEGRWRLGLDTVKIRVPQSCLDASHTLRMNAAIGPGNGTDGGPFDVTKAVTVPLD